MRRTRAIGAALLSALALAALFAPVLTPHTPLASSPITRMRRRCVLASSLPTGGCVRPFVRPVTLVDRLERRFEATGDGGADPMVPDGMLISMDESRGRGFRWEPTRWAATSSRLLFGARLSLSSRSSPRSARCWHGLAIGGGGRIRRRAARDRPHGGRGLRPGAARHLRGAGAARGDAAGSVRPAGLLDLSLVLAAAGWPLVARGVRGIIAAERRKEYVGSCVLHGGIPIADSATSPRACDDRLPSLNRDDDGAGVCGVGGNAHAGGLGFPVPAASWGAMLRDAWQGAAFTDAPWLMSPALALALTVLVMHMLGSVEPLRPPPSAHTRKSFLKSPLLPNHMCSKAVRWPTWNTPAYSQVFQAS